MSQIHGKQIIDSSIGLVKWDVAGSQGTITFGTGSMIGVNDAPTNGTDLANKDYVDSIASGLDPKESVSVKSTTNHVLSGLASIDGYTPLDGERVLLTDQTDPRENGIYNASVGSWTRSTDSDGTPASEVTLGNFTFVGTGSQWGSTGWVLAQTDATDGDVAIIPDVDTQIWVQFSDAAAITDGAGVNLTGQVLSVDITNQGGLTFSTTGNSGTLEVETGNGIEIIGGQVSADLLSNGGLSFNGSEIQVDPTIAGDGSTWTSGVLNIVGGTGVTVNANDIEVDGSSLAGSGITWNSVAGQFEATTAGDIESVTAGAGLTGGGTQGSITLDVQVDNGLSISSDVVVLGGTLSQNTTIDGNSNSLEFNTMSSFNSRVTTAGGTARLDIEPSLITLGYIQNSQHTLRIFDENNPQTIANNGSDNYFIVRDGTSKGIIYEGDFSANFTPESLITKRYVDNQLSLITGDIDGVVAGSGLTGGGTAGTVTLDVQTTNGLSIISDSVGLGGTLTQDTLISGGTINSLEFRNINDYYVGTRGGMTFSSNENLDIKSDVDMNIDFGHSTFGGDLKITDNSLNGYGAQYTADYTATFVTNSLITKGYVDTALSSLGDITEVIAGTGLSGGATQGVATLEVVAGVGITIDGSGVNSNADATLTTDLVSLGLTAGVNSIQEALTALLGERTSLNSEQTKTAVASGGNSIDTTYDLVGSPATDHEVNLYINGQLQRYGAPYDYYFSSDGTVGGIRPIDAVVTGDSLVWNATQAGFDLTVSDLVTITYEELV